VDEGGCDQVGVEDPGQGHPSRGELLDDPGVGRHVQAQTAVGLGDERAEQPEVGELLDQLVRVGVGVFEVGGDRQHVALDERPDGSDELIGGTGIDGGHGPMVSAIGGGWPGSGKKDPVAIDTPHPVTLNWDERSEGKEGTVATWSSSEEEGPPR
jgi:hypothetical protein